MHQIARRFANDEAGFIVSIELILIATIAVIGLMAGFLSVRDAVVSEMADVGGAIQDLNQGYSFFGVTGHSGSTAGSDYTDTTDFCDTVEDIADSAESCIIFDGTDDEDV